MAKVLYSQSLKPNDKLEKKIFRTPITYKELIYLIYKKYLVTWKKSATWQQNEPRMNSHRKRNPNGFQTY